MTATTHMPAHEESGFRISEWIFTTDHKRIGLLYLSLVLLMFAAATILGLILKLKLMTPGNTLLTPQQYNAMFTLHGVIMIFLVVIPSIPASFGNIFLPLHHLGLVGALVGDLLLTKTVSRRLVTVGNLSVHGKKA